MTDCTTCDGTGIGQHGDPDTSKCHSCNGRGCHDLPDENYDFDLSEEDE